MNKIAVLFVFALTVAACQSVLAKDASPKQYVEASVTRVEKHESHDVFMGSNPTDAPLADPETYAYDVSLQSACGTYVARYENWYDYLPSQFSAGQKIQIRVGKGVIYVTTPTQKEIELQIISKQLKHGSC